MLHHQILKVLVFPMSQQSLPVIDRVYWEDRHYGVALVKRAGVGVHIHNFLFRCNRS